MGRLTRLALSGFDTGGVISGNWQGARFGRSDALVAITADGFVNRSAGFHRREVIMPSGCAPPTAVHRLCWAFPQPNP